MYLSCRDQRKHHKFNMKTSVSFFTEGDSLYSAGDYEGAIENYTAAISMADSRRVDATSYGDDATFDDDRDAAESKLIHFRSLSHRSEAYLALSKYEHAYTDARAALELYSLSDSVDDYSASAFGLCPWEMASAQDRVTRALAGVLENATFVPGSTGAFGLQLEDMQDDTMSVMKHDRFY